MRTDAGPFREGWVVESPYVWYGLPGGKEAPLGKSQVRLLRTGGRDGGKYEGGGGWDWAPADGKSFWVTKGWPKGMVPKNRWKAP